jgi:hypothetical protein
MRFVAMCLGVVAAAFVSGCGSSGMTAATGTLSVTVREVNMPTGLPGAPLAPTRGYVHVTTHDGRRVVKAGVSLRPVPPQPSASRVGVVVTRIAAGRYTVDGGLFLLTSPGCPQQSVKVSTRRASHVTVTCDASGGG